MVNKRWHGWLVVNQFLNSNKYSELYQWLSEAGKNQDVTLTVKTNAELIVSDLYELKVQEEVDFILFWDKDIRLAMMLEELNLPLFNSAGSIEMCDDKSYTYLSLKKHHVPLPKSIIAPKTYENIGYNNVDFLTSIEEQLGYPVVVKECFGSFGWQVYLAKNREEFINLLQITAPKPLIFQEFIASSAGKDMRLQVVGEEVVASMLRQSTSEDFRANLTLGGKMEAYEPTKEEISLAIQCCQILGLEFGGVDLLFGPDGSPLVCEVNSNAHFKTIYDCTKVNVAEHIIRHIKRKLIERSEA